ncbi:MAG: type II secretion system F family protein, partial [Candidatus Omnitrophica bacterium]|nr:type II secretion system F family protein [Candidatus Omnitrophota bacterium]
VIGIITVVVLLTYVVPRLAELFAESGQLLPLPTRLLLAISHAVSQWWWLCGLGVVGIVGGVRAFRRSPRGGAWVDRLVLRVPLLGSLVQKAQTARLARNVGAMIGHGVPILQALEVAQATLSNFHMRQAVATAQEAVRDGESLSKALGASRQFPPFVGNLIAVGEESGTLENALLKIASSYERETDRMLQVLTTILEPLLIVLVGLIVMFIVISMLLPIFQLGLVAQ